MTLNPSEEYEYVCRKYAPMRLWEVVLLVGVVAVAVMFRGEDWWHFVLPVLVMEVGWEVRKWRMRRNAHWFSQSTQ